LDTRTLQFIAELCGNVDGLQAHLDEHVESWGELNPTLFFRELLDRLDAEADSDQDVAKIISDMVIYLHALRLSGDEFTRQTIDYAILEELPGGGPFERALTPDLAIARDEAIKPRGPARGGISTADRQPTWEDGPLRDGAVYGTFGQTRTRVLLLGGGFFDVYSDGYGDRTDFLHFSDGFIRQPEPQLPKYELLESALIDAAAVRDIRATGRAVDMLADQPPLRAVSPGITGWNVRLRSGHHMWVMAHRWRCRWRRVVFEVHTVGGRGHSVLDLVVITARSIAGIAPFTGERRSPESTNARPHS